MFQRKRETISIIVAAILQIILMIYCFSKTMVIADDIYQNTADYGFSYNWLLPQFFCIQSANTTLKLNYIVLIICSVIIFDSRYSYKRNCRKTFYTSVIYSLIQLFTFLGLSIIRFGKQHIETTANISLHSILSICCLLLTNLFWGFLMLGILYSFKTIFSDKVAYIVGSILILYVLICFYFRFTLFTLSPISLSKEIVISNFPYWDQNKWVYKANIGFPYANYSSYGSSMPLPVTFIILLIYLMFVDIIPIWSIKQNKLKKIYGINNINNLSIQQDNNYTVELKQYKLFYRIIVKDKGKKKNIFFRRNK